MISVVCFWCAYLNLLLIILMTDMPPNFENFSYQLRFCYLAPGANKLSCSHPNLSPSQFGRGRPSSAHHHFLISQFSKFPNKLKYLKYVEEFIERISSWKRKRKRKEVVLCCAFNMNRAGKGWDVPFSGNVWQLPICSLHHMVWQFWVHWWSWEKQTQSHTQNTTHIYYVQKFPTNLSLLGWGEMFYQSFMLLLSLHTTTCLFFINFTSINPFFHTDKPKKQIYILNMIKYVFSLNF